MKIAKLAPSVRVQGRWLCTLEDGSLLRISEAEVADFGLYSGCELDEAALSALGAAAEKSRLRERALSLLSLKPMSRKELLDKLTGRPGGRDDEGAERALALEIADRLEELGYLNDAEYAKTVVRHYSSKCWGERRLRDELWKRGVPREFWDEALSENTHAPDGIDAFLDRKLGGRPPKPEEWRRLSDALARRGYRWEDIKSGLRRYGAEIEED